MSYQEGAQTSVRRPDGGGTEIVAVFAGADDVGGDIPPTPLRRASRRNTRSASAASAAATRSALAQALSSLPQAEPSVVVGEEVRDEA